MAKRKKSAKKTPAGNSALAKEIKNIVKGRTLPSLAEKGKHPRPHDHVENVAQLVEWGHTRLAADHLLFPEINGALQEVMSGILRRLNLAFYHGNISGGESAEALEKKVLSRLYCYEYLLETSLNFFGHESSELDEDEKQVCFEAMLVTLRAFETMEVEEYGDPLIARAAIDGILDSMALVQGGASMVSKTAGRIRKAMAGAEGPATFAFLDVAEEEIISNIYYYMVEMDYCKFGNDYALGLRWLRHLGFEQVSTNPVLAKLAYVDDPSLSRQFIAEVVNNPNYETWKTDPEKYADEIALCATLFALWDNLHVYRPVFHNLRDITGGGVVSFQLNPNIAHKVKESVADALSALETASEDLKIYDSYLLAGYTDFIDRGRPNMVIKVAASHPAAREIAYTINTYGLGSNITVVYTVAQQVVMILAELAGMAVAMHRGVMPTQLYMTNMGGRLESHLREAALENYFAKLKKKIGAAKAQKKVENLARANGSLNAVKAADSFEEKVRAAVSYGCQKVIDANVLRALSDVAKVPELMELEADIAKSGTLVARRTWNIFFSEKNREKWLDFLCVEFELSEEQADFILSRLNYLPASKRKPEDTFWTLASENMVHTEFGNHQENVAQMSDADDFDMLDYVESIRDSFDPDVVKRLNKLPDFPTAYEINNDIAAIFSQVGIQGDFGKRGHKPAAWPKFGSVMKTSAEFKKAYDEFKNYILGIFPK